MVRFVLLLLAVTLTACPPSGSGAKPVATCTKEGESCTFAEGKLGMCVSKPAPCTPSATDACFVCQSQH